MEFVRTDKDWGLRVSIEKIKLLTMGRCLKPEDVEPVQLDAGELATVEDFTYLRSNISRERNEVAKRLGKASRAFGCLRSTVFQSEQFSVKIKREVYQCRSTAHFALWGRDLDSKGA